MAEKEWRVEKFDLERLLAAITSGEVKNGNLYYHIAQGHEQHLDLTVNMADGERRKYGLLLPERAEPFPMPPPPSGFLFGGGPTFRPMPSRS